jgi:drug/metabolite transporter (DMT)-like permease
MYHN